MQVPLLDLKPQYRALKAEIDAAMDRICDAQSFILGPAVKQLEAEVAAQAQQTGLSEKEATVLLLHRKRFSNS